VGYEILQGGCNTDSFINAVHVFREMGRDHHYLILVAENLSPAHSTSPFCGGVGWGPMKEDVSVYVYAAFSMYSDGLLWKGQNFRQQVQ